MLKLSTGDDSTLGNYLKLTIKNFGERSAAVDYIKQKIADASNGADEEVLSDEKQTVGMLLSVHHAGKRGNGYGRVNDPES